MRLAFVMLSNKTKYTMKGHKQFDSIYINFKNKQNGSV